MDEDQERTEALGFRPQKEVAYNKLLPYADQLDAESATLFTDIKTNLVKAFLAREIRPGCALWTSRLHRYMKIYGLKFSKEDHICLIRLYYEILTIPNLEPTRINKFAGALILLLKKELLSRDDLQLEWRPLYDLCQRVNKRNRICVGMYRYFATLDVTLDNLIHYARTYFPVTATREILDEFCPKLCPSGSRDLMVLHDLEKFLPIQMKPSEASLGYELWLEEFMTFWDICHNVSSWENQMASLMSNLAANHIGYINWEPYVPAMFTRFLRSLHLPVSYRQKQSNRQFKIEVNSMTKWIVSCLGGSSDMVFRHLESFMNTIESYFNVANTGRWTPKIRDFLRKISLNFVNRIHNERYRDYKWQNQVPDEYKLSDAEIDRFVLALKPCLEHSIFSRQPNEVCCIFNYLACLRPNLIIPIVLDKLYSSMDSLTEPHKLTAAMMSISAVSRYMVQGKKMGYPEGPTHVIPLLMNLLPGIDPNDRRKCFMTFNFIVQFITMIPLINSSEAYKYYDDLTEEEHNVCEASAGLEDFVMQFFDRLCTWIESNSLETTRLEQNDYDRRLTKSESIAESALVSVISAVLTQSSPEIFKVALKKVFNFAIAHIFETKVSGKMVGTLCQVFSRVNAKETAKLFIPYLCNTLETLFNDNHDVMKEENLNQEILYNLLLLSEVVDCNREIMPYIDMIMKILNRALFMTSLQASQLGTRLLHLLMTTLTFTVPLEYRSCAKSYDTPIKDYLSIRDWGEAGNIRDLQIKWFMPGEKEVECAQNLLNHYLVPELTKLNAYASGEQVLTRQELRRSFKIVFASLACHTVLPIWKEPALKLLDSVLDPWAFELIVGGPHVVTMPDGSNVRKTVADVIHRVQAKILEIDEGDTKSIYSIIYIYDILLFNKFRGRDFEFHWKNFHTVKTLLEDKLHKNKKHMRHILIDRVMLHQEFRNESRSCSFTETHKQIMIDLFELSTSRYSEARITAQNKLHAAITVFPHSYIVLTPHIKRVLQLNSTEHHEKFKGCLYVLLGPKSTPLVARHDWHLIKEIWPVLVCSQSSENPSIVNLMDYLVETVHKSFPTIAINLEVPERVIQAARQLAQNAPFVDVTQLQAVIDNGAQMLREKCDKNLQDYNDLIGALMQAATEKSLHWRYYMMSVCFLRDLVHPDVKYDANVVRFFLRSLINESIKIRKIAVKVMLFIMMQNKLKYPKVSIDPYTISNTIKSDKIVPGNRPDNDWILYNSQSAPKNADEWKVPRFIHNEYTGFYCWPVVLQAFDYSKDIRLTFDDMSQQQKEILGFFSDKTNVDILIKYYSMEEKKGNDKFSSYRFLLFKYLFKTFDSQTLPTFMPHLEALVEDSQEQSQRCASEIISGIISGCKHWDFAQTEALWTQLIPLLRKAFNNLSEETLFDWASCIGMGVECRDPNRYTLLLEFLMDDPLSESTSYLGCARMYILFCALNQQPWRNAELFARCFAYFKAHLSHPFQNVRDRISTSLTSIFCKDIVFPNGCVSKCPRVADFFDLVRPKLQELYQNTVKQFEMECDVIAINKNEVDDATNELSKISIMDDVQKENLIRLFKIAAKYVTSSVVRAIYTIKSEHFTLLPLASVLQSNEVDDELTNICTNLIVVLGCSVTPKAYLPHALNAIQQVANCPFWSARAVIAEFIPVFVFHNMPSIIHTAMAQEMLDITLLLLEDIQPEVRMKASQAISGFLHVNFIEKPMQLLDAFRKKAKTRLKPHKIENGNSKIRIRHAGVLGLCSFISASPYDVPDYMPSIFEDLGPHLNDSQPIPATIRKTLGDFKRTHHANWEDHKLKFTENELSVLTDLTVPPSYYA